MKDAFRRHKIPLGVIRNALLRLESIGKTIQIIVDRRGRSISGNGIRRHEPPLEIGHGALLQGIVCRSDVRHDIGFKGCHGTCVRQRCCVIEKYYVNVIDSYRGSLSNERGTCGRRLVFRNRSLGSGQHGRISTPYVGGRGQHSYAIVDDMDLKAIRGRDIEHGMDFVLRSHSHEKCSREFIAAIPNRAAVFLAHGVHFKFHRRIRIGSDGDLLRFEFTPVFYRLLNGRQHFL
jgi:hypothetical protein